MSRTLIRDTTEATKDEPSGMAGATLIDIGQICGYAGFAEERAPQ
jgi:hypothetical protein